MSIDLKKKIRDVPDFPKKGIVFKDITTLIADPLAFKHVIEKLKNYSKDKKIDVIVGIESRGFIFGAALAYELGKQFAIVRKPGKLPYKTVCEEYELEYGKDKIEMHIDSIKKGQHALIVDDLLATGGTALATAKLIERLGGIVEGFAFIIELGFLNGRGKIRSFKNYDIYSLVNYDKEVSVKS